MQGSLGDCWLLSSLAALAEFPEVVQYVFVDDDVNPSGKYTLRIFDISKGESLSLCSACAQSRSSAWVQGQGTP